MYLRLEDLRLSVFCKYTENITNYRNVYVLSGFRGFKTYQKKFIPYFSPLSGARLVNVTNASETSTLTVDPAVRASSSSFTQSAMPWQTDSDASKVLSRGPGLSKAFVGQKSNFSVDCSKAGKEACLLIFS